MVKNCKSSLTCPVYSYRLGRNPKRIAVRRQFPTRINEIPVGNGQAREERI